MWKRFLLSFFVFGLSASCFGASVNWNASIVDAEHGAPDGYRVYYGYAADQLTTTYDVGNQLNFPIPETWNPATYYFGVRAYNAYGESGWATTPEGQTWVAYTKSDPPPILPPAQATDVQIVWEEIEEPQIMTINEQFDSNDNIINEISSISVSSGVGTNSSQWVVAIGYLGDTGSSDLTVEARLQLGSGAGSEGGPCWRMSGTTGSRTGYFVKLVGGNRYCTFYKFSAGSLTYLDDFDLGSGNTVPSNAYFRCKVVASGSTHTLSLDTNDDGTYDITTSGKSDSSYSGGGVGIRCYRGDNNLCSFDWVTTPGGGASAVPIFGSEISSKVLFGGIVR